MQGFAFAANVRNDGPHCSMVEDAPRSAMGRKQTREPVRFWEQATIITLSRLINRDRFQDRS